MKKKFRAWDEKNRRWYEPINDSGCYKTEEGIKLYQYTGLKDKNEKEIYEGDVVEFDDGDRYYVSFADGTFTLMPHKLYICNINTKNLTVIGNIFDNPELLEKVNEED